jgi:hypothetical protein
MQATVKETALKSHSWESTDLTRLRIHRPK